MWAHCLEVSVRVSLVPLGGSKKAAQSSRNSGRATLTFGLDIERKGKSGSLSSCLRRCHVLLFRFPIRRLWGCWTAVYYYPALSMGVKEWACVSNFTAFYCMLTRGIANMHCDTTNICFLRHYIFIIICTSLAAYLLILK